MRKKLSLESLSVDSFATTANTEAKRGTVRAAADDCTCNYSCLCRTAAYYCATVMATVVSCTYTANVSCDYDTNADSCGCSAASACDSYPVCIDTETC